MTISQNGQPYWPPTWDHQGADDDRRLRDMGLIIRGANPFERNRMMLVLAGRGALGTEAACTAALEPPYLKEIFERLKTNAGSSWHEGMTEDFNNNPFWAMACMESTTKREPKTKTLSIIDAQFFQ